MLLLEELALGGYCILPERFGNKNCKLGILCCVDVIVVEYIDSELIEKNGADQLISYDAILVPGGFGSRGINGKIMSIKYARESGTILLNALLNRLNSTRNITPGCAVSTTGHHGVRQTLSAPRFMYLKTKSESPT